MRGTRWRWQISTRWVEHIVHDNNKVWSKTRNTHRRKIWVHEVSNLRPSSQRLDDIVATNESEGRRGVTKILRELFLKMDARQQKWLVWRPRVELSTDFREGFRNIRTLLRSGSSWRTCGLVWARRRSSPPCTRTPRTTSRSMLIWVSCILEDYLWLDSGFLRIYPIDKISMIKESIVDKGNKKTS